MISLPTASLASPGIANAHRKVSFYDPAGGFTVTDRISGDVDLITARINYHFGGPIVAKY
jgi:hypothetical protein